MNTNQKRRLLLWTALALAATATAARADPVADFYAGKNVTLIIGSGVGGSYDAAGRLVAQYLKRYIPGNPTVVPQNMPGASSVRAVEYVFNVAPHDGTTLGFVQPTVILNKVLDPKAKYDPRGLTWIGRLQRTVFLGIGWHDAPAHSIEEAKKNEIVIAGNAATGAGAITTTGYYTAPQTISASQTVTVIATAANGATGQATVSLSPGAREAAFLIWARASPSRPFCAAITPRPSWAR